MAENGQQQTPQAGGNLLYNLVLFGRLLRGVGIDVNPGRMLDVVQALQHINIGQRADFYHTLRSLLVHRQDELPLFDEAFTLFWRQRGENIMASLGELLQRPAEQPDVMFALPMLEELGEPAGEQDEDEGEVQEIIEVTRTYSTRERLYHKDFGEMTAEELAAVRHFMAQMVWELGRRRTRRYRPGRPIRLDLRRSLRRNLRYGGEIVQWPGREPKFKPRPLVILADISGSMEQYSRLLLHFVYGLAEAYSQRVEAFTFGTRLTRITRQLRGRELDAAVREVSRTISDWSGGTRIGESLKSFNFEWGRRVLGQGAVTLIISDGWDRGEPELLRTEMARLQRNCYRVVWLNPLLGSVRYEPLTRGIQAALPYIDDFLPVHNLRSLEDLAQHLSLVDLKRPGRSRQPAGRGVLISQAAFIGR